MDLPLTLGIGLSIPELQAVPVSVIESILQLSAKYLPGRIDGSGLPFKQPWMKTARYFLLRQGLPTAAGLWIAQRDLQVGNPVKEELVVAHGTIVRRDSCIKDKRGVGVYPMDLMIFKSSLRAGSLKSNGAPRRAAACLRFHSA